MLELGLVRLEECQCLSTLDAADTRKPRTLCLLNMPMQFRALRDAG
jgi:hypothetical protein